MQKIWHFFLRYNILSMYKFLCFILMIMCSLLLFAQGSTISMLNDRFSFTFPDSAKIEARQNNAGAANNTIETRVVYNSARQRIVFFAQDLFILGVDSLEKKILRESTKENPYTVDMKDNLDSTILYKMNFKKFNAPDGIYIMYALIIKNADNTLSRFTVYFNKEAFMNRPTNDSIVNDVFNSYMRGGRLLNLKARTETFSLLTTKSKLSLKIPNNYFVAIDKNKDRDVLTIKKMFSYDNQAFSEMIVYFGTEPNLLAKGMKIDSFKVVKPNDTNKYKNITWNNYFDKSKSFYLREQVFGEALIKKGLKNHIAMMSNKESYIEELNLIVRSWVIKYGNRLVY